MHPGGIVSAGAILSGLYELYVSRVYRYALACTRNVEDAQDLTSETFRAALEGYTGYRPEKGTPLAWLMGIAHHRLLDHFRRSRFSFTLDQVVERPESGPCPEDLAEQRIQLAELVQALGRLTPERAEALALYFFAELSLAEVGQVMSKNDQAVKKLIYRGLADLKQRFGPLQEKEK